MTLSCYICRVDNGVNICSFFKCWHCGKVACSEHALACLECDRTFCVLCLPDDKDCDCDCDSNYTETTDEEYEDMLRKYTTLKDDIEDVCR
jgi:hypothetical protein